MVMIATTREQCAVCYYSPLDGSALLQCSKCLVQKYCSKECQKIDWRHHKHACGKPPIPGSRKDTCGNVKTEADTLSVTLDCEQTHGPPSRSTGDSIECAEPAGGHAQGTGCTGDADLIYYLMISRPLQLWRYICGPLPSLEFVKELTYHTLKLEKAVEGMRCFDAFLASSSMESFSVFRVPLPTSPGDFLQFILVQETNKKIVAAFREATPGEPITVYSVSTAFASRWANEMSMRKGDQSCIDKHNVQGTHLSKDDANYEALRVLVKWQKQFPGNPINTLYNADGLRNSSIGNSKEGEVRIVHVKKVDIIF